MMALLLSFLGAFLGFSLLALAMGRHSAYLAGRSLGRTQARVAQGLGLVLLAASLAVCVDQWRASVGAAIWLGVLTFAALALAVTFTYCPRRHRFALLGTAGCGALLTLALHAF